MKVKQFFMLILIIRKKYSSNYLTFSTLHFILFIRNILPILGLYSAGFPFYFRFHFPSQCSPLSLTHPHTHIHTYMQINAYIHTHTYSTSTFFSPLPSSCFSASYWISPYASIICISSTLLLHDLLLFSSSPYFFTLASTYTVASFIYILIAPEIFEMNYK